MLKTKRKNDYVDIQTLPKWDGKKIEVVLRDELLVSKKLIHQWRMNKSVLLNNEINPLEGLISTNDILSLPIYAPEENDITAFSSDISISYEDDDILIVDKKVGMNTHPDSTEQCDTLLNAVSHYFQIHQIKAKPRHIHRLDRDTSGLVLFAKNAYIGSQLDRLLEQRKIKRSYAALVEGIIIKDKGIIRESIGRDRHANRMRVSSTGQTAVTSFEVLKRFQKNKQTLVKCSLETGRTHQIRVHMSSIDHPLVGDTLYGGKPRKAGQALHAYQIEFSHPLNGSKIDIKSKFDFLYK
ncbi:MAG: RluA family pseudouridine synthase [Bacillales bacterium]|jgi:23S rRNA pseudouridine1911/1915/1917 synthase|nr:RluA family pseudouridine synthase [Bacillales bacterium]